MPRTTAGPPPAHLRVILALVLLAGLVGCTGSSREPDERSAASPTDQASSPEEAARPTRVLVGNVVGRLPKPRRRKVVRQVTSVVDDWLDAAYVGGTWPRRISGAFDGFTPVAARRARRDRSLTTGADVAERIDGVRVTKRAVRLDLLSASGRPVGVTARVTLDYKTSGDLQRKVSVRGRLLLTPARRGWKVFAYDLTKGKR